MSMHDEKNCDVWQCKECVGITPSEAVYGFAGWLSSSDISLTIGAAHDASKLAFLVNEFCNSQGFEKPRAGKYPTNLRPYPKIHTEEN